MAIKRSGFIARNKGSILSGVCVAGLLVIEPVRQIATDIIVNQSYIAAGIKCGIAAAAVGYLWHKKNKEEPAITSLRKDNDARRMALEIEKERSEAYPENHPPIEYVRAPNILELKALKQRTA